jgi:hypothetical protein
MRPGEPGDADRVSREAGTRGEGVMKKVVIIGGIAVVAIAIVAVYYLLTNLNAMVAAAIEEHGSEVTDTRVGVSGVDISLREGRGSISGLRVASPPGFETKDAFSLGDVTVDIDVKSVRDDPIIIEEVRIRAPVVHAEVTASGALNIDELRKRVQAYGAGSKGGGGGDQRNVRIKKFVFEEGRIELDATALGAEERTLKLPAIHLAEVGGANGAPADEIAKVILGTMAKKVSSEIANSEVKGLIKDQLGEALSDKAKGLLDKVVD